MKDTTSLDCQLADLIWMMVTALRAGYPVQQVFEQLASDVPEPAASACAQVAADLNGGLPLNQALMNWQQATPSIYLEDMIAVFLAHGKEGGNLPALLEPVGEAVFGAVGSDLTFIPAMQRLAQSVGASLPQRVQPI